LADADIWWDEGLAVWAVRRGIAAATAWTASDVHPPLFFWLLGAWRALVGESAFALRYQVALTGVLLAALVWALAYRAAGPRAAGFGLALCVFSRYAVWWSMELRMYTLAALAVTTAAYAALRWLGARDVGLRWLVLYAIAGLAALHSVYLSGIGLACINVGVLAAWLLAKPRQSRGSRDREAAAETGNAPARVPSGGANQPAGHGAATGIRHRRGRARRLDPAGAVAWAAAQAVILVGFTPWAIYATGRMPSWRIVDEPVALSFVAELWAALVATGISTDLATVRWPSVLYWSAAGFAPAAGAVIISRLRHRGPPFRTDIAILAAFALLAPLAVWLAVHPRGIFYSPRIEARYFLPFAGPVYALFGSVLAAAGRRLGAALFAVALSVAVAALPPYFSPRRTSADLPAMALAIWSQAEPGDVVLLVSGNRYPLFLYHYERSWDLPFGRQAFEWPLETPPSSADRPRVVPFPSRGSDTLEQLDDWQADLESISGEHRRIWLVELGRELQDPSDEVEAWLAKHSERVLSEGYGPDALHLFDRDGRSPRMTGLSARWPGTVQLVEQGARYDDGKPKTAGARDRGADPSAAPTRSAARLLPLAGLPARRVKAGDSLELALFASVAGDGPRGGARDVTRDVTRDRLRGGAVDGEPEGGHGSADASADGPEDGAARSDAPAVEVLLRTSEAGGWTAIRGDAGSVDAGTRSRHRIEVDDGLPGGRLQLEIVEQANGHRKLHDAGTVQVGGSPPAGQPADMAPLDVDFGGIRLVGARVADGWRAGEPLVVDLAWRVGDTSSSRSSDPNRLWGTSDPRSVVAFVHLIGPPRPDDGSTVWAGDDGPPSSGPWCSMDEPGCAPIFDRRTLAFDVPNPPSGVYELELGLYDPATGERIPPIAEETGDATVDADQRRVLLPGLRVRR